MDRSTEDMRAISHRIANAGTPGAGDFADLLGSAGGEGVVDLEREMVALADTQIQHEAANNLLKKVYQQTRVAFRTS